MDSSRLPRHAPAMSPKSTRSSPTAARVVEVVAYPAVQLLDVTGPLQVFATANDLMAKAGEPRPYEIRLVAPQGQKVNASAGVALVAEPLSPADTSVDTLVVAGGQGAPQLSAFA